MLSLNGLVIFLTLKPLQKPHLISLSFSLSLFLSFSLSFSLSLSGACCPSSVRLYGMAHSSLRVHWCGAGSSHSYVTELVGSRNNYTCTASPGESSCDVPNIQCGDVYTVVVAPLTPEGSKVLFCAQRIYSGRIVTSLLFMMINNIGI